LPEKYEFAGVCDGCRFRLREATYALGAGGPVAVRANRHSDFKRPTGQAMLMQFGARTTLAALGMAATPRLLTAASVLRRWSYITLRRHRTPNCLQIPSLGHESPLAAHFFEPTQGKLTESEHGFDDAEHGFRRLFAQGVERAAFRRLQFMGHRLDRRRLFRGCRRRREAHAQLISANRGRPARLPAPLRLGAAPRRRVHG